MRHAVTHNKFTDATRAGDSSHGLGATAASTGSPTRSEYPCGEGCSFAPACCAEVGDERPNAAIIRTCASWLSSWLAAGGSDSDSESLALGILSTVPCTNWTHHQPESATRAICGMASHTVSRRTPCMWGGPLLATGSPHLRGLRCDYGRVARESLCFASA
jgi:hypothetical protein